MAHQKVLMQNAGASDSRLQFELDTIAGGSGPERVQLLYLQGQSDAASRVSCCTSSDALLMPMKLILEQQQKWNVGLSSHVREHLG